MLSISRKEFLKMAKAKTAKKSTRARVAAYRPSNFTIFVIVSLLVALGTVTWLFISLTSSMS